MSTTTDTTPAEPTTLLDRLADAEQAEQALAQRVTGLETELRAAASAADYGRADKLQKQLAAARGEHDTAKTTLGEVQGQVDALDAGQAKALAAERAQRRHTELMRQARAADTEADQRLAEVHRTFEKLRGDLQAVISAARTAGQSRREAFAALIAGGTDPRLVFDADRHYGQQSRALDAIDKDPLLKQLVNGRYL